MLDKNNYYFVIECNQYVGNFHNDMVYIMTGAGYDEKINEKFRFDDGEDPTVWNDKFEYCYDEHGEGNCMVVSENVLAIKYVEKLTDEEISFLKERANFYIENQEAIYEGRLFSPKNVQINGFKIIEESYKEL